MENINKGLLTHIGSMNYIVQVWGNINSDEDITVQNYMPRKTLVCQLEVSDKEELIKVLKRHKKE